MHSSQSKTYDVLVYGWYGHHNFGDDLFVNALQELFPEFHMKFVDFLTQSDVKNSQIVIFGGGSMLEGVLACEENIEQLLQQKLLFYLGIGTETNIHPSHDRLLERSLVIATRSSISNVSKYSHNKIIIPDLTYVLTPNPIDVQRSGILIVVNASVVPSVRSPHWQYAAWTYFKSEFSQALDDIASNELISFMPMCTDTKSNDEWAAAEIINSMSERNVLLVQQPKSLCEARLRFATASRVITQRYHGQVLATMTNTPCVVIDHHKKLTCVGSIPYYEFNKDKLKIALYNVQSNKLPSIEPLKQMQSIVREILERAT